MRVTPTLTPKLGGGNPYEKMSIYQLAKRASRGDFGAAWEADQRLHGSAQHAVRNALPKKKQRELGVLPSVEKELHNG